MQNLLNTFERRKSDSCVSRMLKVPLDIDSKAIVYVILSYNMEAFGSYAYHDIQKI